MPEKADENGAFENRFQIIVNVFEKKSIRCMDEF